MSEMLQIGMHFDATSGGADRYFAGLLGGLREIGVPFQAAAFGASADAAGVSLGAAQARLPARLAALRRFGREAILPGRTVATHFALYAWPVLRRLRQAVHVAHFHGPWAAESAAEGQSPFVVATKRWIESRVYRSARRLITLSAAFRDLLSSEYAVAADRITVVPGGVDVVRFRCPDTARAEMRAQLGWPSDGPVVFCVRRLAHRMGLENLIAAFGPVAPPAARLVVAGRGPLAATLARQVREAGLADRVVLAGFVSDAQLPLAYAAADLSVVPSVSLEGFGLITAESLACGTPVLVTPVGGLPEAVAPLDERLVVADASVDALAAGLQRALQHPASLPSREACREYAVQRFAWPVIARQVVRAYETAANA